MLLLFGQRTSCVVSLLVSLAVFYYCLELLVQYTGTIDVGTTYMYTYYKGGY